jgi:hypothetical protein
MCRSHRWEYFGFIGAALQSLFEKKVAVNCQHGVDGTGILVVDDSEFCGVPIRMVAALKHLLGISTDT